MSVWKAKYRWLDPNESREIEEMIVSSNTFEEAVAEVRYSLDSADTPYAVLGIESEAEDEA